MCGIGAKRGVLGALCGMKTLDLTTESMKILGLHFSYNESVMIEKNFIETIVKIENVLRVWRQRSLTLEGKIVIFKTLAISKLVHTAYLIHMPQHVIEMLEKIKNDFLWNNKRTKIKHNTLCNKFEKGGLQKVDIRLKIDALQLSWVRRLYDENDHQWKKIPKILLTQRFGDYNIFYPHFKTHLNLSLIPKFYKNIMEKWSTCSSIPIDNRNILEQNLWHNQLIIISNKTIFHKEFHSKGIMSVHQLFSNGIMKKWHDFKTEFRLDDGLHFKYIQLIDAIPREWKIKLRNGEIYEDLQPAQGVLSCTRLIPLEKLISKEIYSILLRIRDHVPTAKQSYNEKFSNLSYHDWANVYTLPRKVTKDAYLRYFQYKILNNILYLNKKLFTFGKSSTQNCSFCENHEESIYHIFNDCLHTIKLWDDLVQFFISVLNIPRLSTQSALLGFLGEIDTHNLLINHLLLLFKLYVYQSREKKRLHFPALLVNIKNIYNLELKTESTLLITKSYSEKWSCIRHLLN